MQRYQETGIRVKITSKDPQDIEAVQQTLRDKYGIISTSRTQGPGENGEYWGYANIFVPEGGPR